MLRWIVLFFVVTPLVELYLLLWLADATNWGVTVALTLFTGLVGGSLAKREGLKVWRRWRMALERFEPPEEGVIEGLLVLVGGVLLVTPGVLTDLFGFSLLVPATRRALGNVIRRRIDLRIQQRGGGPTIIDTPGTRLDG